MRERNGSKRWGRYSSALCAAQFKPAPVRPSERDPAMKMIEAWGCTVTRPTCIVADLF